MKRLLKLSLKLTLISMLGVQISGCSHRAIAPDKAPPLQAEKLLNLWESLSSPSRPPLTGRLTVEQAIDEALKASPELAQIRQRIEAADEQVRQAEAAFYPRLVFSETYNDTNNPVYALMNIINQRRLQPTVDFNHPGAQQNFSTKIKGEWSLFQGGSRWFNREAAANNRDSVEAERLSARNKLIARVAETYYRWLQSLGFIEAAEKSLRAAEENERIGAARVRAQVALESDLMRLKARTAEAHGNLVSSRTAARRFQAALERLMARPILEKEIPKAKLAPPPSAAGELDPLPLVKEAFEKRPELAAVRSLIQAARMRVRSAQGQLLPELAANADYQLDSEDFSETADSWMVAVQATWTLFQGGMNLSKIREARARLKQIESKGEQVALDIALEVHQAVLAVQEASEKIQVAEERKKWAKMALEEVRNQYRNQVVTVDALVQADVSWSQAEVSYTAALFDAKIAQALLRQALGEFAGWTETRSG